MEISKRRVFLLQHVHILNGAEDVKTIGIYSSMAEARKAIQRLRLQPGFRRAPKGFTIDVYVLNQDQWEEGYVTLRRKK